MGAAFENISCILAGGMRVNTRPTLRLSGVKASKLRLAVFVGRPRAARSHQTLVITCVRPQLTTHLSALFVGSGLARNPFIFAHLFLSQNPPGVGLC